MSEKEQPMPTVNRESGSIIDLVLADIRKRDEIGKSRYGVSLQAWNGRDSLRDAYEEVLDLAFYLRQVMVERNDMSALKKRIEFLERDRDFFAKEEARGIKKIEALEAEVYRLTAALAKPRDGGGT